jgi:hypothetical protein
MDPDEDDVEDDAADRARFCPCAQKIAAITVSAMITATKGEMSTIAMSVVIAQNSVCHESAEHVHVENGETVFLFYEKFMMDG